MNEFVTANVKDSWLNPEFETKEIKKNKFFHSFVQCCGMVFTCISKQKSCKNGKYLSFVIETTYNAKSDDTVAKLKTFCFQCQCWDISEWINEEILIMNVPDLILNEGVSARKM